MIMPANENSALWDRPKKVHFALFPYVVEIPSRSQIENGEYEDDMEYLSDVEMDESFGNDGSILGYR